MQAWFMLLLILGIVIGYSLPGDWRTASLKPLKAGVYDVSKKMGQLDNDLGDFKYTTLVEVNDASVELFKVDNGIPVNFPRQRLDFGATFPKGKIQSRKGAKLERQIINII